MTVLEAREAAAADTPVSRVAAARVAQTMGRETRQSVYLMVLMGAMLSIYIGLGLLAVRVLG